jgi:hypothetical protein
MHIRSSRTWASAMVVGAAVLAGQAVGVAPASATTIAPGSVQVVAVQSPFDNQAAKSFSANCPAGQRVLGGGAFTVGGVHAVITEMQPIHTAPLDSFRVSAAADQSGIAGVWSFQVFAFCASVPSALGLEIVPHANLSTSAPSDRATAQCPPGKLLIGAGGKIDNGGGQVDLSLFTDLNGQTATAAQAFGKEDVDGFAGNYTVTGYSVCAVQFVTGDIQQLKTGVASLTEPSLRSTVACPSGLRLTGLAGGTTEPGTHMQRLSPRSTNGPNLADFGSQSSVPPRNGFSMQTTVFCAR